MQKQGFKTTFISGAAVALVFTFTAQAQNNRSFVATTGNDINNCTASAYCRTFTRALAVTNSGGEVVVVNSGGYGPATITQAVVITAIGIDASITATSGNALTINTTGNVTITGLNLNGGGAGFAGVSVTQVGFLRLYSMQVQNFTNSCVDFEASHGNMVLNDSKVNDCYYGLYQSGGQVYVRNTEFDNNSNVAAYSAGGTITIADSSAHYNNYAFATQGGTMELYGDRAIFNTVALYASNGSLYFADCLVSANTYSYDVGSGGTMAGSSPGTSLITLGQLTVGALSAAQTLF